MKKNLALCILLILIFPVFSTTAQSEWQWFSRNKVPLYNSGAKDFTDFRVIGGKAADGFLPGHYLTKQGEQVNGEVQYNYPYIMERMLVFRANGKITFLTPSEVKGYFVDGIYRESVTFNAALINGADALHTFFMIPKLLGVANLFYYTSQEIDWQNSIEPKDDHILSIANYFNAFDTFHAKSEKEIQTGPSSGVIKKGEEVGFLTDRFILGFPNKMSALVAECAELAQKVKSKQTGYKSTNLVKILEEYNVCLNNR